MRTERKKWLAFFAFMVACCPVAYVIGSSEVCGACRKELCPDKYHWGPEPAWNWDPEPDIFAGRQEARFENRTQEKMFNVTATVTCVPVNVEATDTQVSLGDIPAGESAWSSDTFEPRVDMTNLQEPNNSS